MLGGSSLLYRSALLPGSMCLTPQSAVRNTGSAQRVGRACTKAARQD